MIPKVIGYNEKNILEKNLIIFTDFLFLISYHYACIKRIGITAK